MLPPHGLKLSLSIAVMSPPRMRVSVATSSIERPASTRAVARVSPIDIGPDLLVHGYGGKQLVSPLKPNGRTQGSNRAGIGSLRLAAQCCKHGRQLIWMHEHVPRLRAFGRADDP